MSYQAIITPIINIRPHSNADRIILGTAAGHQVIISKDTEEGTMGIFLPSDGQLSVEMCYHNNLHRHTHLNKDIEGSGGFFDDNRRVRAQQFRGEISEGFWAPLELLEWTEADLDKLKEGELLEELNGVPICNKYYTPATRRMMGSGGKKRDRLSRKAQLKAMYPYFYEHYDVQKLRMFLGMIPSGAILSLTEKCHGTSARTGKQIEQRELNWFQKLWNRTIGKTGLGFNEGEFKYISGTRRVVLDPKKSEEVGFYSGKKFRNTIHQQIKAAGLHHGETLYYEIVGYDDGGGLIMGAHGIEDKALKKKYGNKMVYKYGCKPGEWKLLVYRITHTSLDGHVVELSWNQVVARCKQLGMLPVPLLKAPFIYDSEQSDALMSLCERLSHGCSTMDDEHIREGVVVRVEAEGISTHYKYKGFWFCELEGIAKNSDDYVDPEEVG